MSRDLAVHMIHSQYQLDKPENQEILANAKMVIVGPAWYDYSIVKAKAPNAKILVSFNCHNFYDGNDANVLWKTYKDNLNPARLHLGDALVVDLDYPQKNYMLYFTKENAKLFARVIWDMVGSDPLIDGIYLDDCWGNLPRRYLDYLIIHYNNPETEWDTFRLSLLRSLNTLMPKEKIVIANTGGYLAPYTNGITLEANGTTRERAIELFETQQGFWNVDWFRIEPIEIENSYMRVLKGVSAAN